MIVITGAAGFIGSALVWGFNRKNFDDIIIVDDLQQDERWKNLVNLSFYDFIHKDEFLSYLEGGTLNDSIEGIIHMGACSDTTEKDADYLLRNNYEYTKYLALWSIENNKRFVYASSAATYGDGSLGFSDSHDMIEKLRPLNMYGYSKQIFDRWALNNGFLEKIAGLKYFNVFGPNEYHKGDMRSVVHKAFEQIIETGRVRLFKSHRPDYEDGWQMRDFIYVKDAVDITIWLYEHTDKNGIFNVGTGKARSFFDLTSAVFNALGRKTNIEYIDIPENIREKYQYFTQAEMKKLHKAGYRKKATSLEDAIEDYVKNYLLTGNIFLH
ncbi:ADP-glyceromanno-heptose 6-epimerase [bacterium]|nr:ADP-glyceromanno-heptose 6-epimerase [bacterium]